MADEPRMVNVQLELRGGHRHELTLAEDGAELFELIKALGEQSISAAGTPGKYLQLPVDEGRSALTLLSTDIVAIQTTPPVLLSPEVVQLPPPVTVAGEVPHQQPHVEAPLVRTPYEIVDGFLSPDEHRDMLAYALQNQDSFQAGTVTTDEDHQRRNLVIMDFTNSAHAQLIVNRLLILYPMLMKKLGKPLVPIKTVESQLTASNDKHYFKPHQDSGYEGDTAARELSCVYYFHREPRGYGGGQLRLFDRLEYPDGVRPAESFIELPPESNRLVVFPSDSFHELTPIRCPSGDFADSRFAVTTWIWRAAQEDPQATFGWGHFHCGVVPRL